MSVRIVWQMADGAIAVTTPTEPMIQAETDVEFYGRLMREVPAKRRQVEDTEVFLRRIYAASTLVQGENEDDLSFATRVVVESGQLPIPEETVEEFHARLVSMAGGVRRRAETMDEYTARIVAKLRAEVPELSAAQRLSDIDHEQLPPRRFRHCWRADGTAPAVDLVLAKEQVVAEVRAERNKLLTASDMLKAKTEDLGTPEEKTAVADYRQSLRDLPVAVAAEVDAITSLEDLISYAPALPEHPEKGR